MSEIEKQIEFIKQSNITKIAIAGHAGAGKSRFSNSVIKNFNVCGYSLAKPMKETMTQIQTKFGLPHKKDRSFLLMFGKFLRQTGQSEQVMDPILYVCLRECFEIISKGHGVVIDDLRLPIEYEFLKSLGFVCIRLVGREMSTEQITQEGGSKNHITEVGLNGVDLLSFDNSEDMDNDAFDKFVYTTIDSLFKKSLKRRLSSESNPEIKKQNTMQNWDIIELGPKSWIKKIELDKSNGGIDTSMFEKLWALKPNEKLKIKIAGKHISCPRYSRVYLNDYFFTNVIHKMEKETPDIIMDLFTKLSNFTGIGFNQILVNWYDDDGSIGAHSDDTSQLKKNSEILSVSYFEKEGDTRMFLVEPKSNNLEPKHVVLKHNTCLIMCGECQNTHKHSVPKDVGNSRKGKRINITLRQFKKLNEFALK